MAPDQAFETDTVYPSAQCLWSFSSSVGYCMPNGVKGSDTDFRSRRSIWLTYSDDAPLSPSAAPLPKMY
jgi:hypothetical protein